MNKQEINRISRKDSILTTQIDGEVAMFDVDSAKYLVLNDVASVIWELLENPISIEEIVSKLIEDYDIEEEQCRLKVNEFIQELVAKNLLK